MYRKSRKTIVLEAKRKRCAAMRAAKARKRKAEMEDAPGWRRVGTYLLTVEAAPDGRHMAIAVHGGDVRMVIIGSERSAMAGLRALIYRRAT